MEVTAAELAVVGVAAREVEVALAAQRAVGEFPGVCQLVRASGARDDERPSAVRGPAPHLALVHGRCCRRCRRTAVEAILTSALHLTPGEFALVLVAVWQRVAPLAVHEARLELSFVSVAAS
jgi:hypothetical protein